MEKPKGGSAFAVLWLRSPRSWLFRQEMDTMSRGVPLPWWPSRQSVHAKRGSEAPCLTPLGAQLALMWFWGGPDGASLWDAPSVPSVPLSIPTVPCECRSSWLCWDRVATIAEPLYSAPAAPLTASHQAILPFLLLQPKCRLLVEQHPIFPARRALSYSLARLRAHQGCTHGL